MLAGITDIDRLVIGILFFLISYFIYLLFRKNKSGDNDVYPLRLSKLPEDEHFKSPANNLDGDISIKYEDAMLSYDAQNFAEAIAKLTDCISVTKFSEFYYYRGICHFALKEYQSSINDWQTAIKLFPEYEYELSSNIIEAKENLNN
jgi:tetratricopeptide (TPR) repeat protein